MSEVLVQTVINGVLWGCIYGLIALGLTIVFGVMDITNFAHGEFLMVSMFLSYVFSLTLGLNPLAALPLTSICLFLFGVLNYRILIKPVLNAPPIAQIFATFGLMVFLRGVAQFIFGADFRTIPNVAFTGRIEIAGIFIATPQLVAAIGSAIMFIVVYLFISKTRTGWALMAVAENKSAATLMGINSDKMFALAWGISCVCVGVAGSLLANFYYVFPEVGGVFGFLAFVTVALGGFGSIVGAFYAGLIIGLTEALAGVLLAPSIKYLVVFMIYLLVVIFRPRGLLGNV